MRPLLALPALVPLALSMSSACATSPTESAGATAREQAVQQKLAERLAGLTPGEATSCLPITYRGSSVQTQGYGRTILYSVNRNLVFRNDTTGGCENIARGDILVTVQPEGRACRGDIARTVEPVARFTTGSCALGDFVPYQRAK